MGGVSGDAGGHEPIRRGPLEHAPVLRVRLVSGDRNALALALRWRRKGEVVGTDGVRTVAKRRALAGGRAHLQPRDGAVGAELAPLILLRDARQAEHFAQKKKSVLGIFSLSPKAHIPRPPRPSSVRTRLFCTRRPDTQPLLRGEFQRAAPPIHQKRTLEVGKPRHDYQDVHAHELPLGAVHGAVHDGHV